MAWLAVAFNYYLLLYLLNTFEMIYLSAIGNACSDLIGYAIGGYIFNICSLKMSLFIPFLVSSIGGILLLTYGLENQSSWIFPFLILLAKLGINAAFYVIYAAHSSIFPLLKSTTTFGICNFTARFVCAFAPIVAQMEEPTPILIFTLFSAFACFLSLGIKPEM